MKDRKDDLPTTDEFEPIELGSVLEETKGEEGPAFESSGVPGTKE